jgi:hypothetical protein
MNLLLGMMLLVMISNDAQNRSEGPRRVPIEEICLEMEDDCPGCTEDVCDCPICTCDPVPTLTISVYFREHPAFPRRSRE